MKLYETDDDYMLDVLIDEEERLTKELIEILMNELIEILPEKPRYKIFRYLAVKDLKRKLEKVKTQII